MSKNPRLLSKSRLINSPNCFPFVPTLLASTIATHVYGGPTGGVIIGGVGNINQSDITTTVNQSSSSLAIDWNTFNLNGDEYIRYVQPNSSSVVLNRILDNNTSQIHGRIDANGHVVLVNPNGIFFGENASINVGGLIASGLAIDPVDFMNGDYFFSEQQGTQGKVINTGIINAATGGSVSLIAKQVENRGLIAANLGAVNLAAGKEAIVTFDSSGLVGVKVTKAVLQEALGVDPAVLNGGEISAAGGRILLTGSVSQNLFSQTVNTGDLQQATSMVVDADGNFTLGGGANVVNTGTLDVSSVNTNQNAGKIAVLGENISSSGNIRADGIKGEIELHASGTTELIQNSLTSASAIDGGEGGLIKLLGKNVGLFNNAQVNASGNDGGGKVLIGGDRSGSNQLIRNADFIFLGENTHVSTNALLEGNGGTLITFASDTARLYGKLSSHGGLSSGNGGFIETSGLIGFEILQTPDISASLGHGGEWLIDPYNIDIVSGSGSASVSEDPIYTYTSSGANAEIGWVTILDALSIGTGTTVTIKTGGVLGDGNGKGDITLKTDADFSASGRKTASLNLHAHNDIIINNYSITSTGSGDVLNLQLDAGNNIEITGTAIIDTAGGNFIANSTNFTLGGETSSTTTSASSITTGGGEITINASGSVKLYDDIFTNGGDFTVGSTMGPISFESIFFNASGVEIDHGVINTSSNTSKGGSITISTVVDNTIVGDIRLGTLNVAGANNYLGGDVTVTSGNNITLEKEFDFHNTGIDINSFRTLTFNAHNDITINAKIHDSTAGSRDTLNVNLNANLSGDAGMGSVKINADIYTGGGNFEAKGFDFTNNGFILNTDYSNSTGNSTSSQGGNVMLEMMGSVTLGTVITDNDIDGIGNLTIIANGRIGDGQGLNSGVLDVTGATTLNANGHAIILDAEHDFKSTVRIVNASDVTLYDRNDITLGDSIGTSVITGSLSVTSNGADTNGIGIKNGGLLDVGATTLNASGHAITLDAAHDFNSTVRIVSASDVILHDNNDITLGDNIGTSVITGSLSVTSNGADINGIGIKSGGRLDVGATTLNASGHAIRLDAGNDFKSTVHIVNASDVTLNDINSIILGDSLSLYDFTVNGNLTVTANGVGNTITQNRALNATGLTTLTANAIELKHDGNNFNRVAVTAAGSVSLHDKDNLILDMFDITGNASLYVQVGGNISQYTNVATETTITTAASVDANFIAGNGQDILLGNSGNNFGGTINFNAYNNGNNEKLRHVSITNTNNAGLVLQALDITGDLTAKAEAGAMTQNGALIIGDLITMTATGNNITLLGTNDFNKISVIDALNVELNDINNIQLDAITLTGNLSATAQASNNFTQPAITQTGVLDIDGTASFKAHGGENIELNRFENKIDGAISFTAAADKLNNVSITNAPTVNVHTLDITGNLTAESTTGSVTQSGIFTVAGITNITAGDTVTLTENMNDFNQINLNAWSANVTDKNTVQIGNTTIAGANSTSLKITALGVGGITQAVGSQIINNGVGAVTELVVSAAQGITLEGNTNDFTTVAFNGAGNVSLVDANTIDLSAGTLQGSLTVVASNTGNITQSGTLVVANDVTTLTAGGNIILTDTFNDFSQINSHASTASIRDANNIMLGNTSITGTNAVTFNVVANGNIGQAVDTTIVNNGAAAITNLEAIGNNINLAGLNQDNKNDFTSLTMQAENADIVDINSLDLGAITLLGNGGLNVKVDGNISNNSGALQITGPTTLTAGNGAFITLDNASNQFTGALSLTSSGLLANVSLTNTTATQLQALAVSNNLTIKSTGEISQNGAISVGNLATLSASDSVNAINKNITLMADNTINSLRVENVETLAVNNATHSLNIAGITATGDITIAATGLHISGGVSGDSVSLVSGSGEVVQNNRIVSNQNGISISGGTYKMTGSAKTLSNKGINITVTGAVDVGELDAKTSISLTSQNADIRQSAAITSQGDIVLTAGAGINMAQGSTSTTRAGNITYIAAADIGTSLLEAQNSGTVFITSNNGQILDVNGGSDNLIAHRLELRASSGIGARDSIEIQTAQLFAENASGRVELTNRGNIAIERLQSNGNIRFVNDVDINVASGSVDANYDIGSLFIQTERGNIFGIGSSDFSNADITAKDAVFIAPLGDFGRPERPIVLNVKNSVFIQALRSWSPFYLPPGPISIQDDSNLQLNTFNTLLSIGGHQLIEVETLEEIDPAIFTDVRNYAFSDVSIRLPQDQLFDDELDKL